MGDEPLVTLKSRPESPKELIFGFWSGVMET